MGIKRTIKNFFRQKRKITELENNFSSNKVITIPNKVENKTILFDRFESVKVSIIIPFYNQEDYTKNCLWHLSKHLTQKHAYEIILIDDNSSETYNFDGIENIKILKNESNLGFLKNCNKGILEAKGEYIYLLNNDTEVKKDFLDELFHVFENNEDCGAVGSMLINADGSLQEAGSVFMKDFQIHQIVRKRKPYYPDVNYVYEVDYCSGCSLLFKKYQDDKVTMNLLDEDFAPAYFEETDFCFQLRHKQNKKIYFTPFSKVLHFNGVSYNSKEEKNEESLNKKAKLFEVNKEKFWNKWNKEIKAIEATSVEDRVREIAGKKSIIFVTGEVPPHDKDSGSNRLKEIMLCFKRANYHVTLIVKNTYINQPYTEYYQRLGIQVYYHHLKYKNHSYFVRKKLNTTNLVWYYGPGSLKNELKNYKKLLPNAKHIFDMVDIHHLRYERALELEPNDKGHKKRIKKYKKIETELVKKTDYLITISDDEKQYMSPFFPEEKTKTISNIHYPKIKESEIQSFENRKDIIFIGSTHHPNVNAVYYLYEKIMPLVWKQNPEIKVHIIGNINEVVKNINDERFVFEGFVPDIVPFFQNAKIMVAPLQIGAGVKGKIGQAFEYFLPLVTTKIGAEGMFLENNKNALLAENENDFSNAIVELYNNKEIWQLLSENSEKSLYPFSREKVVKTILEEFKT